MTPVRARLAVLVTFFAAAVLPGLAHADGARPYAAEAEEVGRVPTRDSSLVSPTEAAAVAHIEPAKRAYGVAEYDRAIDEYVAAADRPGACSSGPVGGTTHWDVLRASKYVCAPCLG